MSNSENEKNNGYHCLVRTYNVVGALSDTSVVEPMMKDIAELLGHECPYELRDNNSGSKDLFVKFNDESELNRITSSSILIDHLYRGRGGV
ncbi:MAG: hypothetical protein SPL61_07440 [Saccharofermentans sp.]|nr:hypothetical protein [Saccharofermentans sp.]